MGDAERGGSKTSGADMSNISTQVATSFHNPSLPDSPSPEYQLNRIPSFTSPSPLSSSSKQETSTRKKKCRSNENVDQIEEKKYEEAKKLFNSLTLDHAKKFLKLARAACDVNEKEKEFDDSLMELSKDDNRWDDERFTAETLVLMPTISRGFVEWGGESYEVSEWKDEVDKIDNKFPVLTFKGCALTKTQTKCKKYEDMIKAIAENIDYCWEKLSNIESTEDFRVDMWGNVVCLTASPTADDYLKPSKDINETVQRINSITSFGVDHIFPWLRGGLSNEANFAAIQFAAKKHKDNKIIQSLHRKDMLRGISVVQFQNLLTHASEHQLSDDVFMLLKMKLDADNVILDFQEYVNRSEDGEEIYNLLNEHLLSAVLSMLSAALLEAILLELGHSDCGRVEYKRRRIVKSILPKDLTDKTSLREILKEVTIEKIREEVKSSTTELRKLVLIRLILSGDKLGPARAADSNSAIVAPEDSLKIFSEELHKFSEGLLTELNNSFKKEPNSSITEEKGKKQSKKEKIKDQILGVTTTLAELKDRLHHEIFSKLNSSVPKFKQVLISRILKSTAMVELTKEQKYVKEEEELNCTRETKADRVLELTNPEPDAISLTVMSWNIREVDREKDEIENLKRFVEESKVWTRESLCLAPPDIVCLQEVTTKTKTFIIEVFEGGRGRWKVIDGVYDNRKKMFNLIIVRRNTFTNGPKIIEQRATKKKFDEYQKENQKDEKKEYFRYPPAVVYGEIGGQTIGICTHHTPCDKDLAETEIARLFDKESNGFRAWVKTENNSREADALLAIGDFNWQLFKDEKIRDAMHPIIETGFTGNGDYRIWPDRPTTRSSLADSCHLKGECLLNPSLVVLDDRVMQYSTDKIYLSWGSDHKPIVFRAFVNRKLQLKKELKFSIQHSNFNKPVTEVETKALKDRFEEFLQKEGFISTYLT